MARSGERLKSVVVIASMICLLQACADKDLVSSKNPVEEHLIREEQVVLVSGLPETWRLVWEARPSTVCGPDEVFAAITCPCSGWAYAEYGKLSLVRIRGEHEIERMDLRPLFGKFDFPDASKVAGSAYLQRWPMEQGDLDRENDGDPGLIAEIERRPAPQIIQLADYDRDGDPTEFLVQVGTMPCGKLQFAAIGLTKAFPHLHALASVANPNRPLIMPMAAWHALLSSSGPNVVSTWECGDHGSSQRTELIVWARDGEIQVKAKDYTCPVNGESESLLNEIDL